jgi:small subunit ribosomal protein S21
MKHLLKSKPPGALRASRGFFVSADREVGTVAAKRSWRHWSAEAGSADILEVEMNSMTVIVHGNDIDKALRDLKRVVQRDGIFKEIKRRRFYEKPSVKKKRKRVEAERRRRKALRSKRPFRD